MSNLYFVTVKETLDSLEVLLRESNITLSKQKTILNKLEAKLISNRTKLSLFELVLEAIKTEYPSFDLETLRRKTKRTEHVTPRQIFANLVYKFSTTISLKEIGKYMKRDHTTVIHSRDTVEDLVETDKNYRNVYERIYKIIKNNLEVSTA